MSNGEHEIRTPKGLRIGNRSVVDGKNMLQIKRGGCEDYISAESLVECIHGLPVKSIEFFTAENQRKEYIVEWAIHIMVKMCVKWNLKMAHCFISHEHV